MLKLWLSENSLFYLQSKFEANFILSNCKELVDVCGSLIISFRDLASVVVDIRSLATSSEFKIVFIKREFDSAAHNVASLACKDWVSSPPSAISLYLYYGSKPL